MLLPVPLLRLNKQAHKNDFGHLLVVAGSPSMLGASCLVSLSAMRFGAGLVTAAIPRKLNMTLQTKISHAVMTLPLPSAGGDTFHADDLKMLQAHWKRFTALVIGPGMGLTASTQEFIRSVVTKCPLPMVVDADGLNALASWKIKQHRFQAPRILTPHPGEFFRLSGSRPVSRSERVLAAKTFSNENNIILILKGHQTVVAAPDQKPYVNTSGNAGMAKAGMGDVLSGMIGALLAQGIAPFEAAKLAVYHHGHVADKIVKNIPKRRLIATDIINAL